MGYDYSWNAYHAHLHRRTMGQAKDGDVKQQARSVEMKAIILHLLRLTDTLLRLVFVYVFNC